MGTGCIGVDNGDDFEDTEKCTAMQCKKCYKKSRRCPSCEEQHETMKTSSDPFKMSNLKILKTSDDRSAPDVEAKNWRERVRKATAFSEGTPRAEGILSFNQLMIDASKVNIKELRGPRMRCTPRKRSKSKMVREVFWNLDILADGIWALPASQAATLFGSADSVMTQVADVVNEGEKREKMEKIVQESRVKTRWTIREEKVTAELSPHPRIQWMLPIDDTEERPQQQALDAAHDHWDKCIKMKAPCTGIISLQPGKGKTRTGFRLAWERVIRHGGRCGFIVDNGTLVTQAVAEAMECMEGVRVGIAKASIIEVDPDDFDVVIYSMKTVQSHIKRFGVEGAIKSLRLDVIDMMIYDEAHHLAAEASIMAHRAFNCRYHIYLTATPNRDDGLHHELRSLTGPILYRSKFDTGKLNVLRVQYKVNRDIPKTFDDCLDFPALMKDIAVDEKRNHWGARVIAQMIAAGETMLVTTLLAYVHVPSIARLISAELDAIRPEGGFKKHKFHVLGQDFEGPLIACTMSTPSFSKIKDKELRAKMRQEFRDTIDELNAIPEVMAILSDKDDTKKTRMEVSNRNQMLNYLKLKHARCILGHASNFYEGFNVVWLSGLFSFEGYGGESYTVQLANRVTRAHENKEFVYIIDYADEIPRLGRPQTAQTARCKTMEKTLKAEVIQLQIKAGKLPTSKFWSKFVNAFRVRRKIHTVLVDEDSEEDETTEVHVESDEESLEESSSGASRKRKRKKKETKRKKGRKDVRNSKRKSESEEEDSDQDFHKGGRNKTRSSKPKSQKGSKKKSKSTAIARPGQAWSASDLAAFQARFKAQQSL